MKLPQECRSCNRIVFGVFVQSETPYLWTFDCSRPDGCGNTWELNVNKIEKVYMLYADALLDAGFEEAALIFYSAGVDGSLDRALRSQLDTLFMEGETPSRIANADASRWQQISQGLGPQGGIHGKLKALHAIHSPKGFKSLEKLMEGFERAYSRYCFEIGVDQPTKLFMPSPGKFLNLYYRDEAAFQKTRNRLAHGLDIPTVTREQLAEARRLAEGMMEFASFGAYLSSDPFGYEYRVAWEIAEEFGPLFWELGLWPSGVDASRPWYGKNESFNPLNAVSVSKRVDEISTIAFYSGLSEEGRSTLRNLLGESAQALIDDIDEAAEKWGSDWHDDSLSVFDEDPCNEWWRATSRMGRLSIPHISAELGYLHNAGLLAYMFTDNLRGISQLRSVLLWLLDNVQALDAWSRTVRVSKNTLDQMGINTQEVFWWKKNTNEQIKALGNRARGRRLALGLAVEEAYSRSGLSDGDAKLFELGEFEPSFFSLRRVAWNLWWRVGDLIRNPTYIPSLERTLG